MAAPMHTTQCVLQLIKSVRALASQDDFTDVASLFSDLASLRQNLDAGNDEVKRLNRDLEVVRAEQEDKLQSSEENYSRAKQDFLRSHREAMTKVEQEKNDLRLEILSIRLELKDTKTEVDTVRRSSLGLQKHNADILNESHKLKAKLAEAETEMQTLRLKIGAKDKKIASDKENLRQQGISIAKLRANLDSSKQERQEFEEKLGQCKGQLSKVTGFSKQLPVDDAPEFLNQLQELWLQCWGLMRKCAEKDLSESMLNKDPLALKSFKKLSQLNHSVPLPPSNSREAKNMKAVVLQVMLAASLVQKIFTVTYQMEEDGEFRDLLLALAEVNSCKESFLRGMLASLPEENEVTVIKKRVKAVVFEVSDHVRDLLGRDQAEFIRSELESVVDKAAQIWKSIQKKESRFEADTDTRYDTRWQWNAAEFSNDSGTLTVRDVPATSFAQNDAEIVLFPRVFIVKEERDIPVFPGVVLQSSQMIRARQELDRNRKTSRLLERVSSMRKYHQRRASMPDGSKRHPNEVVGLIG